MKNREVKTGKNHAQEESTENEERGLREKYGGERGGSDHEKEGEEE